MDYLFSTRAQQKVANKVAVILTEIYSRCIAPIAGQFGQKNYRNKREDRWVG